MMKHRFRYYSKNRKLIIKFTYILGSSLLVILFSLFMQNHLFETKKMQNENLYGSWHGAVYDGNESEISKLFDNRMISQIGFTYALGDVQFNNVHQGSIGYVDDTFLELSNIDLMKGSMPNDKDEIAIEKMKLDQMGLDYTLDQTISIQLIHNDKTISKEYKLCGIINNYSATWLSRGRLLSFFIIEDKMIDPIEESVFFTVDNDYLETLNDISQKLIQNLVINTNVEFTYDPLSSQNLPYTLLFGFAIIYTLLLLLYTFQQWTRAHGREIQTLKALGASMSSFLQDFIESIGRALRIPLVLSILCVFIFSIPILIFILGLTIYLLSLSMILISFYITISKVPVNINSFTEDTTIIKKTFKIKYKTLTPFRLMIRSFRFHLKQELLQIIICVAMMITAYTSLTHTIQNSYHLKQIEKKPDISITINPKHYYTIETKQAIHTFNYYPDISEEKLNQYIQNNAITSYRTYYIDTRYYAKWNNIEQSPAWDDKFTKTLPLASWVREDWNNIKRLFPNVYSSTNTQYYDFLSSHIDKGEWNQKDFEQGDTVYIYLPAYTGEYIEEKAVPDYSSDPQTFYDPDLVYQDQTLKVGDTITLQAKDQKPKTCKVGGIISQYYDMSETGIPNNLYQIFVSSAFYDGHYPTRNIDLYLPQDETSENLESHFSSLAVKDGFHFYNLAQEKRREKEIVQNDLVLFTVLLLGILCILTFSQVLFISQKRKELKYQYKVFYQLGIPTSIFNQMQIIEMCIKIPMILIMAFGSFACIQYVSYLPEQRLMYPFSSRFSQEYWSWPIFVIMNISFVLMVMLCSFLIYNRQQNKRSKVYETHHHTRSSQ